MAGLQILRKRLLLLFFLVLYAISSGFSMDVCSNTILPGSKGDPGEVGDAGDEGRLGKTGPPGQAGVPGENGEKGDTGRTGKPGPAGEQGKTGDPGTAGDSGLKGKTGSTCDCGRYRKVVGQMDININKLKNTIKFLKTVILGVKETEQKFYLLVKEERKHSDAQLTCRLRGGTLAVADSENISTLLGSYISEAGLTHVLVGTGGEHEHVGNSTVSGGSCTHLASNGALSPTECDAQKFYICEFSRN
ncbi:collectin-10 [Tachysurus vachellii]|uniref:collectin-10 n=1 Tax=Tachysurus vachellii TaxID=175792 RepID=UPI00296B39E9|nr:collectin-10 [Tachysurus vachellii]